MTPLGLLSDGEYATVALLAGSPDDDRVESLGLRPGRKVEMLSNGHPGPVVVRVDESRLALGRGLAMRILVSTEAV